MEISEKPVEHRTNALSWASQSLSAELVYLAHIDRDRVGTLPLLPCNTLCLPDPDLGSPCSKPSAGPSRPRGCDNRIGDVCNTTVTTPIDRGTACFWTPGTGNSSPLFAYIHELMLLQWLTSGMSSWTLPHRPTFASWALVPVSRNGMDRAEGSGPLSSRTPNG